MAILTSDFSALTDDLQSIWNEAAKNSIADLKGFNLFNVKDTDRRTFDHLILHGMGGAKKVAQGADLPSLNLVQGRIINFFQNLFNSYRMLPCVNSL